MFHIFVSHCQSCLGPFWLGALDLPSGTVDRVDVVSFRSFNFHRILFDLCFCLAAPGLNAAASATAYGMSATSGYAIAPANSLTSSTTSLAARSPLVDSGRAQSFASQTRIGSGCKRLHCSYIHNENINSDRDAPLCPEFSRTARCGDPRCTKAHNINPIASPSSPQCNDFRNLVRYVYWTVFL